MSNTYAAILAEAIAAGQKAVENLKVVPMVVGTAKGLVGNDIDYSKPTYFVEDGVCGFASVNLKPATGPFAKYLKECGWSKRYGGGIYYWVSGYNQSMQKKEAFAYAYAKVLQNYGYNAWAESRMD